MNKIFSKEWPIVFIVSWLVILGLLDAYAPVLNWVAWGIGILLVLYVFVLIYVIIKYRHQISDEIRHSAKLALTSIKTLFHK